MQGSIEKKGHNEDYLTRLDHTQITLNKNSAQAFDPILVRSKSPKLMIPNLALITNKQNEELNLTMRRLDTFSELKNNQDEDVTSDHEILKNGKMTGKKAMQLLNEVGK